MYTNTHTEVYTHAHIYTMAMITQSYLYRYISTPPGKDLESHICLSETQGIPW